MNVQVSKIYDEEQFTSLLSGCGYTKHDREIIKIAAVQNGTAYFDDAAGHQFKVGYFAGVWTVRPAS